MSFGEWLGCRIDAAGKPSTAELLIEFSARGVKVSRQAVWSWKRNVYRPSRAKTATLLDILGATAVERAQAQLLVGAPLENPLTREAAS